MSTFYGRYEEKIAEWEHLIATDPENKDRYEEEMYDYMADCVPYMLQLNTESKEKHTIDTIFTSKSKKGIQRQVRDSTRTVRSVKLTREFTGDFPRLPPKSGDVHRVHRRCETPFTPFEAASDCVYDEAHV